MKKIVCLVLAIPIIFSRCTTTVHTTASVQYENPAPPPPAPPAGYEMFYNELSPYGRWIDFPGEGYAWSPNVDEDFRPYATNGHWVYSDYGWTWVSGYSWGWAAFHYGRWMYQDGYGWIWFPGHEWAPAWVTWGNSGSYYGWAPLAPHVNINASIGGGGWNPPQHYWNFVPKEHITQENVNNYVVNRNTNVTVINNITKNVTIINNNTTINNNVTTNNVTNNITNNRVNNTTVYNQGPQINEVENVTRNKINVVSINEASRPGTTSFANNRLSIYRPQVKQPDANSNTIKPVPAKVETYKPPVTNGQTSAPGGRNPADNNSYNKPQQTNQPATNNPVPTQPNQGYSRPQQNNQPVTTQTNLSDTKPQQPAQPVTNNPSATQPNQGYTKPQQTNQPVTTQTNLGDTKPQQTNQQTGMPVPKTVQATGNKPPASALQPAPAVTPVPARSGIQPRLQPVTNGQPSTPVVRNPSGQNTVPNNPSLNGTKPNPQPVNTQPVNGAPKPLVKGSPANQPPPRPMMKPDAKKTADSLRKSRNNQP